MAEGLAAIPGVTVVNEVPYTQVMFRLDDDAATRALGAAILADGTAVVTGAEWGGRAVLRCSMSSWVTTPEDIEATLAAFARLVGRIPADGVKGRSGGERGGSTQRGTGAQPHPLVSVRAGAVTGGTGCRSASTRSYCRWPNSR